MLDKLVANAVEFADGGAIAVRLEQADGDVQLSVSNDGPPLAAGMQSRLFDSMVSVRAAGDAGEPHLGLGLYIVRVIAEFHGGRAQAANKPDGSGVIVVVTLPAAVG